MNLLSAADIILYEEDVNIRHALEQHMMGWPDILRLRMAESWPECQAMMRKYMPDKLLLCRMSNPQHEAALEKEMRAHPSLHVVAYRLESQTAIGMPSIAGLDEVKIPLSLPLGATFLHALRHKFRQESLVMAKAQGGDGETAPRRSFLLPPLPPKAIAIGVSTGGPQALQRLTKGLAGAPLNVPVFITQHLPAGFAGSLADQLSKASGLVCREAVSREKIEKDVVYIAPGDYHLEVEDGRILLTQGPEENFCRPAVDVMVRSLSKAYDNRLLVAIMTGMGQDGLASAKLAHHNGATIIAQDEKTSTVWGMSRVVAESGICTAVLPLLEIATYMRAACGIHT